VWHKANMPEENRLDHLMDWEYQKHYLAPIGVTVILVANAPTESFWRSPRYGRDVGDVLIRTNLGRYEGSKFHPGIWHFFTVATKHAAKALELVRDGVRARGLAESSQIALADPVAREWRAAAS
jgi:hypothetical protein